ncbi:MAG: phosphoribosylformylglycinamidine cyclo-ligase, partial [Lentisphaeria bacterium]|nr:phosphoribosylformylglycinamidine cyclo-ligase [Lentisphaeria bacterium]
MSAKSDLYKAAGVDIDLAQNLLGKVKGKIGSTRRPEMLAPIGGFGGMFQVDVKKYKEPVMVTSIDGVGTKLMIAG